MDFKKQVNIKDFLSNTIISNEEGNTMRGDLYVATLISRAGELVKKAEGKGAKASITITLELASTFDEELSVTATAKAKYPATKTKPGTLFVDGNGNVVEENPRQGVLIESKRLKKAN